MKKLLLMFALAGTLAFSQTQVAPIVNPHIQLFNTGVPCSGCLLDTFAAGTTTPLVTYSESTGTTPNANPVVADASGFVTVYMTTSSYKLRLRTAAGVTLWTQDNVSWNNLASTLGSLTVTGNSIIKPAVAATGGANQNSPTLCIDGFYFNITSLTDQWCLSDVLGTGTAPTTTFTVTHAGSGGTATINLPNVAVAGITGLTNAGDETNSATSTVKWGSSGVLTPDTGLSRVSAGVLGAGNGTQGSNTATVQAGGFWINSGAGGVWNFVASMFDQISTGGVRWSSGANATTGIDTGVTRGGAAATIAVGNGIAGNASGTVKAAKLNNGTDLAIPATGVNVVSDTATQTLNGKTLTGAATGNAVTLVNFQAATSAVVGTGADATVYTFSIPGNTMQAGKGIRISVGWQHTTGAASVSYKLKYGATTVSTNAEAGTAFSSLVFYVMNNPASTSAQTAWQEARTNNAVTYATQLATPAENTTGVVTVSFTFNVAATDQVTPKYFLIEQVQ